MIRKETHRVVVERRPPRRRQRPRRRLATASASPASASASPSSACRRRTRLTGAQASALALSSLHQQCPPYQPKEVILASLQYSEGNNRWVNRAKDESSNKLHALFKPMLEQWEQLHDDPSCTPTKSKMFLFLSRACLLELGCLPRSWPYPAKEAETCAPLTGTMWLSRKIRDFHSTIKATWELGGTDALGCATTMTRR